MKLRNFFPLSALLPVSVLAGTVVYSDSQHLPENLSPDVSVVLLDEPERLQAKVFGQLPVEGSEARQHFAKGIQMNNTNGVATHKRHHKPAAGFRQAETFEA